MQKKVRRCAAVAVAGVYYLFMYGIPPGPWGLLLSGDVMTVLCSFDDHTSHTISLLLNTLLNIIHSSGINNIDIR